MHKFKISQINLQRLNFVGLDSQNKTVTKAKVVLENPQSYSFTSVQWRSGDGYRRGNKARG